MSDDQAGGPGDWVDRHGDVLYRYALLRLRSPDLAADVVQETFLEALRARGSFAGRSTERTWLVGILRHKIVDHFRRSGRRRVLENGHHDSDAPARPDFDHRGHWRVGPAAWAGDPSRDMETREFWDAFGLCLSRLPPGLADAFLLRELDGLDADEVRQLLGITPANLWTRLHRARSLLRRCLESGWFGRPTTTTAPRLRDPKGPPPP
jgi:RNA polymerase sigma-70 factor (ECF subfamily)